MDPEVKRTNILNDIKDMLESVNLSDDQKRQIMDISLSENGNYIIQESGNVCDLTINLEKFTYDSLFKIYDCVMGL